LAIVALTFTGVPAYTSLGAVTVTVPLLAPPAIVIVSPLLSVTVTGEPTAAGWFRLAVYVIVPPSATLAFALRLTVVVSTTSVIVVAAGVALTLSLPDALPISLAIVALTFTGVPAYTSLGAVTVTVPLLAP